MNAWVAIVTVASLIFYMATAVQVGRGRARHGVAAPAMTGHPEFERLVRVQVNTLEWLVIYLPCLWLFAVYVEPRLAAALGGVWIVGRVLYARGYARDPASRSTGFLIQGVAILVLMLGALGGAIWSLVRHGA
jgi:uncharacterized MAPEG superfamily protein